ncbi:flagellar biosynthesis protein FlhF [Betaproteobacteria bacterium GR16-43]|nr:flagellar biosynthesis protein FlhF [Betaproteobacteria bacterium GR16-43]
MSARRYTAPSTREALAQVRRELGAEAVILSNRRTPTGVEVVAVADGDLDRMIDGKPAAAVVPAPDKIVRGQAPSGTQSNEGARSFKEYVAQAYVSQAPEAESAKPARREPIRKPKTPEPRIVASTGSNGTGSAPVPAAPDAVAKVDSGPGVASARGESPEVRRMHEELGAMRRSFEKQLAELNWNGVAARDPIRAQLASELSDAGFSRDFARLATEKMEPGCTHPEGARYVEALLTKNLGCAGTHDLVETGGVFALVGPTGVGKTTTVAKLAARAVVRFGAAKVALVSADGYRIGAQEQLRTYAQILGVPLHAAHDAGQLAQVLEALKDRHLVLIDTAGLGPRDARISAQTELLNHPRVKRIVLLSAAAEAEALARSVRAYAAPGAAGAILTKLDEAAKLGGVLDAVLRHRLALHFVTNGQRVPEDLHSANAHYLAHRALRPDAAIESAWRLAA